MKSTEGGLVGTGTYKRDVGVHFIYFSHRYSDVSAILIFKEPRHVLGVLLGDSKIPRCVYDRISVGSVLWRHRERWLEPLEGRTAEDLVCM